MYLVASTKEDLTHWYNSVLVSVLFNTLCFISFWWCLFKFNVSNSWRVAFENRQTAFVRGLHIVLSMDSGLEIYLALSFACQGDVLSPPNIAGPDFIWLGATLSCLRVLVMRLLLKHIISKAIIFSTKMALRLSHIHASVKWVNIGSGKQWLVICSLNFIVHIICYENVKY